MMAKPVKTFCVVCENYRQAQEMHKRFMSRHRGIICFSRDLYSKVNGGAEFYFVPRSGFAMWKMGRQFKRIDAWEAL